MAASARKQDLNTGHPTNVKKRTQPKADMYYASHFSPVSCNLSADS